ACGRGRRPVAPDQEMARLAERGVDAGLGEVDELGRGHGGRLDAEPLARVRRPARGHRHVVVGPGRDSAARGARGEHQGARDDEGSHWRDCIIASMDGAERARLAGWLERPEIAALDPPRIAAPPAALDADDPPATAGRNGVLIGYEPGPPRPPPAGFARPRP